MFRSDPYFILRKIKRRRAVLTLTGRPNVISAPLLATQLNTQDYMLQHLS